MPACTQGKRQYALLRQAIKVAEVVQYLLIDGCELYRDRRRAS
jgi:hypothetical protein